MPTGRDFSDETWQEIYAARARLEAYKNSVQPYPASPDETTQQPPEQVIVHRHSNMSKQESALLQQAWRKIDYLSKKLLEREKKKQDYY